MRTIKTYSKRAPFYNALIRTLFFLSERWNAICVKRNSGGTNRRDKGHTPPFREDKIFLLAQLQSEHTYRIEG